MKTITIQIQGESGLHARPAGMLAGEAQKFKAAVTLIKGDRRINAKSIMSVLSLGAVKGDVIELETDGEDEEAASAAIENLFATALAHA